MLAPLLAGALTLTAVTAPAVYAADTDSAPDLTQSDGSFGPGMYVVTLTDAPVAAYEGELPRLKRTAPKSGNRLDPDSGAVDAYRRHLDDRRDEVLDAVPGVKALYDYDFTLSGFAAKLTGRQASKLAATPGVAAVTLSTASRPTVNSPGSAGSPTPDHGPAAEAAGRAGTTPDRAPESPASDASGTGKTTSSGSLPDLPAMLGLSGGKGLWSKSGGPEHAGEGMIVGIVDTGFDPSNPMLAPLPEPRPDAEAIAKKWHGTCDEGTDPDPANRVTCNNKVIGAQWFRKGVAAPTPDDVASPLDRDSHGTHTGTTAAGNHGVEASIPGTGTSGKLSGVAPAARLAYYKACWSTNCWGVDTVAAIDRAVADGVDVINYSIAGDITHPTVKEALFNAAKAGVFVAVSAGNSGPGTVQITAPWLTTVAASTHGTEYTASITLGDGRRITNRSLNAGVPSTSLVNAADVRKSDADAEQAALCAPGTLDPARTKDKIVVCDRGGNLFVGVKATEVKSAGGRAIVLTHTPTSGMDFFATTLAIPLFQVSKENSPTVKEYAATENATAGFLPSQSHKTTARDVTSFSSGGPDDHSHGDLLKPDIAAPGEAVPAGTVPGGLSGYAGSFGFMSGTSMASPHIAGLAALLKQLHPGWSPMEVKSALMTTATTKDEKGGPVGRQDADSATPLDYGSGIPRVTRAADPGLVYDSTSADWTAYLCAIGISPAAENGEDPCATATPLDPSDLNYPSISVGDLYGHQTVTRKVTNVSSKTATYKATLHTPPGFRARVTPKRLTLAPGESASYTVEFERMDAAYDTWSYGSLTLSDAHARHRVTSPIALRPTRFAAPNEVTATGQDSVKLTAGVGWTGELTAKAALYTATKTTGTLTGTDKSDFPESPHTNDAVVKHRVHVPEGAAFTRVAITAADHLPGSDIDLYVFDTAGNQIGRPDAGSDEHTDLPPGDYDVYVLQYRLPAGTTSQQYTLWSSEVGQGAPAVRPSVTPPSQQVTAGDRPELTVTWPDAVRGERYVGVVEFGDGSTTVGRTPLTVTP
ncbi:S8 family serine peptidase [Streptomyces sp. V4I2]|uniref:S8 family serine peptidase n=1 Tax=Streptomyces sp. V4I2 TaxID=3042280 RepID=UPI00278B7A63|nr:S8 family serine peptidase [Streptomyces sp. V4I2]MDQ1046331.1 subtilisin family serine protease [Streptomyces sp. V4I2]